MYKKRIPDCRYKTEYEGAFSELNPDEQQIICSYNAAFHYRNGTKHPDGSMGDIKITIREFNNLLAYIAKHPINLDAGDPIPSS